MEHKEQAIVEALSAIGVRVMELRTSRGPGLFRKVEVDIQGFYIEGKEEDDKA